jgi:transcriptional regulator with XRE-family HTH domain
MLIGKRIKELLAARGWSQSQLSKRSGIERSHLCRLINDARTPKEDELHWIATALEITLEELLEGVVIEARLSEKLDIITGLTERLLEEQTQRRLAEARAEAAEEALEAQRRNYEDRLARQAKAHARKVRALDVETEGLSRLLTDSEAKIRKRDAIIRVQAQRLKELQAGEAHSWATGLVIGGLGGLILGGASDT